MEQGEKLLELVEEYLRNSDLAKHNANLVYSLPALGNILSGEVMKDYMLKRILTEEERLMHEEGWWYQHQLSVLGPYCIGFSARDIAMRGLASNSGVMPRSRPPRNSGPVRQLHLSYISGGGRCGGPQRPHHSSHLIPVV